MALAWLFERQQPADIERANRLLAACGEVPWWIPGLWHLEVANALVVAERRALLPPAESDPFPARGTRILALARHHALSSYDATYLELAQRLDAALASFDRQLNRAAGDLGVALFAHP